MAYSGDQPYYGSTIQLLSLEMCIRDSPDIAQWPLEEYLARVKAAVGFCCHAHPFREAYYIVPFQPQPQLFEAFEVFNNHHAPENRIWDQKALAMAQKRCV